MLLFSGVLLGLFVVALTASTSLNKDEGTETTENLQERMNNMERLLLNLQSQLSQQDTVINELHSLTKEQGNKICEQAAKLEDQSRMLDDLRNAKERNEFDWLHLFKLTTKLDADGSQSGKLIPTTGRKPSVTPLKSSLVEITPNVRSKKENSLVHKSLDVTTRSDDQTIEAVVNQISQRLSAMSADIQAIQHVQSSQSPGASSFIRWGNSQCDSNSQLVYSGFVGGAPSNHAGSAVNYLCMTMSPDNSGYEVPADFANYVYGGEYETHDSAQNRNPVCAVCRTHLPATIMIPGSNRCTSGWTKQYSGYLMAGRFNHDAASEFICVDLALQSVFSSEQDSDGKLLYYVGAWCTDGGLPCGPYIHNHRITCAVCSQ